MPIRLVVLFVHHIEEAALIVAAHDKKHFFERVILLEYQFLILVIARLERAYDPYDEVLVLLRVHIVEALHLWLVRDLPLDLEDSLELFEEAIEDEFL